MPPIDALPLDDPPMLEVLLDVGESLRIGNIVLRILDTDGEDIMLRLNTVEQEDEDCDETAWSELPR